MSFVLAFVLSLLVTLLVIKITRRHNLVYIPTANRWNDRVVSLHGGIGIFIAFIFVLAATKGFNFSWNEVVILGCGTTMLILGLIDDLYSLMPRVKLSFQILITAIAISQGIMFVFCDNFWICAAVSALWIIGITNAVNLLDNMDGASAGITSMSLISLALLPHHVDPAVSEIALILSGSILGFLVFNFNPAKIFMGDSGSLFIGTILSLLLMQFSQTINPEIAHTIFSIPSVLLIPALLVIVPIVDTTFVTINRKLNGYPISLGDKGHITHRLSYICKNDKISVVSLYIFQLVIGAIVASYYWKLLYPVFLLLIISLTLLTKLTNHKVWPEKFAQPQTCKVPQMLGSGHLVMQNNRIVRMH